MADITYYVNEPLGTVVARLPNFIEDMEREIESFCAKKYDKKNVYIAFGMTQYLLEVIHKLLQDKYAPSIKNLVGKAKCNYESEEVFDLEKGKELAKQRLMKKVFYLRYCVLEDAYRIMFNDIVEPIFYKKYNYLKHLAEYENNLSTLETGVE